MYMLTCYYPDIGGTFVGPWRLAMLQFDALLTLCPGTSWSLVGILLIAGHIVNIRQDYSVIYRSNHPSLLSVATGLPCRHSSVAVCLMPSNLVGPLLCGCCAACYFPVRSELITLSLLIKILCVVIICHCVRSTSVCQATFNNLLFAVMRFVAM